MVRIWSNISNFVNRYVNINFLIFLYRLMQTIKMRCEYCSGITYLFYEKFYNIFISFPASMHKNRHSRRILFFHRKSIDFEVISDWFYVIFAILDCLKYRMIVIGFFRFLNVTLILFLIGSLGLKILVMVSVHVWIRFKCNNASCEYGIDILKTYLLWLLIFFILCHDVENKALNQPQNFSLSQNIES